MSLDDLLQRPEWHARAACRGMGPELFFPERGEAHHGARKVCVTCSVTAECLEQGMGEHHGTWGGVSERQRRRMRRQRIGVAS